MFCGSRAVFPISKHGIEFVICGPCALRTEIYALLSGSSERGVFVELRCGKSVIKFGPMIYSDIVGLMIELRFYGTLNGKKGSEKWLLTTLLKSGAKNS